MAEQDFGRPAKCSTYEEGKDPEACLVILSLFIPHSPHSLSQLFELKDSPGHKK